MKLLIDMNKNDLVTLINKGYSTYRIASELNRSQTTIQKWITRFGLQTQLVKKYHSNRICKTCGNILKGKQLSFCSRYCKHSNPNRLKIAYQQQKDRATVRKIKLVQYKGGTCNKCGYNKNLASLTFHHRNPKEKSFTIGKNCSQYSWERLVKEADKCSLMCFNCHIELHHPRFDTNNIKDFTKVPIGLF